MSRSDSKQPVRPPLAARTPQVDVVHGERREDDYYWLREKTKPEVRAYLEAENAYTDGMLASTAELQDTLYKEMLGRIKQTDETVPYLERGYYYFSRTEEGKQYAIYCRRPGSLDAPETIMLDLNLLAQGKDYMALGAAEVSDDGRHLAYSSDETGFRLYTLFVKDLQTDTLLPECIEKSGSVVWASDGPTFFYTIENDAKRSYRVFRHRLGETSDTLIYEETDERFNLQLDRSRSGAWIFLYSGSHTTSEVRILPADEPRGEWRLVAPRRQDHEYDLDHHGDRFYIRTNDKGRNFRLVWAAVNDPGVEHWTEVVPHRRDVMLEGFDLFARHYVLHERREGLPRLRVVEWASGRSDEITFPEPAYSAGSGANQEFEATVYRYTYESLITPDSVYDYDMETRQSRLLKRDDVLGGYDPADYVCERLEAQARDGTAVPVSVVYKKGFKRDGSHPLHLYGYGSYGLNVPATFSSNRVSLLDRGLVCALAHVRGGGELGKPWHDAGRMAHKQNTFTDFTAVAEHLITRGYTSADRLVIEGGSAGGLLMGAAVNLRPDLFRAVVSKVPFVDVINTMLDESLPLTVGEFEEWGNPKKPEDYAVMRGYCPYSNLVQGAYPAMLVKTSFNDSQVMYWEPAKYVARLRTLKTDDRPLLLKTNLTAGHHGFSGRYDHLHDVALDYAFVLDQVGDQVGDQAGDQVGDQVSVANDVPRE